MNARTRNLLKLHRLFEEANDGTGTGGGGGSHEGEGEGAGEGKGDQGGEGEGGEGQGGKAKPSDAEAKLLKDVMKHKTAAQAAADKAAALSAELEKFKGIDPVKVRELLAAKEAEETKALEARGEYDRLVKQMAERHKADLEAATAAGATALKDVALLQAQIAELTVGNAFASSTFVKDETILTPSKARVLYGQHFEFKDGKVVGYDKPAGASDRTLLVDASGSPLAFEAALAAVVDADPERDHVRRSKAKPGAGSGSQGREKPNHDRKADRTPIQKIADGLKALSK